MLRVNVALASRHPPPGSVDAGGLDGGDQLVRVEKELLTDMLKQKLIATNI
jgi:hypothetical protein